MRTRQLASKLDRIIERLPPQQEHWLDSDKWQAVRSILLQKSVPYPGTSMAVAHVLEQIERLQPEWYTAQIMLKQALDPFLDARIAIAQELISQ